jgi:hypothetical protein
MNTITLTNEFLVSYLAHLTINLPSNSLTSAEERLKNTQTVLRVQKHKFYPSVILNTLLLRMYEFMVDENTPNSLHPEIQAVIDFIVAKMEYLGATL